jgi:rhamnose transport system permease protein
MSGLLRRAGQWEVILAALIIGSVIAGGWLSPFFLNVDNLLAQTRSSVVVGLLALGLACVVVTGEIDLSGESILAVSAITLGLLWEAGVPIWVAAILAVVLATAIGLANGALVAFARLPSLVVTLGTLIALRGLAYVLLEDRPITGFPEEFLGLSNGMLLGTALPIALVAFVSVAVLVWALVHMTVWGRWLFAIGANRATAEVSGVPVAMVSLSSFALSGALAGLAGVMLAARFASVRADMATGALLACLTVVLLGGISVAGGSGRILGVVLALALVGLVDDGLSLANIPDDAQQLVLGTLLIAAVLVPRPIAYLDDRVLGRSTGIPAEVSLDRAASLSDRRAGGRAADTTTGPRSVTGNSPSEWIDEERRGGA